MSLRIRAGALVAACTLAICGAAAASAGQKSFAETYPVASRLCAKVEAGTEGKRLRASATQLKSDCSTLRTSFETARTAVLAAHHAVSATRTADRASADAACAGALLHKPSCAKARAKELNQLAHLNGQRIKANHAYYRAAEAARVAFWSAVRALPGGKALVPDKPIREHDD
jgi:hypothetical protein